MTLVHLKLSSIFFLFIIFTLLIVSQYVRISEFYHLDRIRTFHYDQSEEPSDDLVFQTRKPITSYLVTKWNKNKTVLSYLFHRHHHRRRRPQDSRASRAHPLCHTRNNHCLLRTNIRRVRVKKDDRISYPLNCHPPANAQQFAHLSILDINTQNVTQHMFNLQNSKNAQWYRRKTWVSRSPNKMVN